MQGSVPRGTGLKNTAVAAWLGENQMWSVTLRVQSMTRWKCFKGSVCGVSMREKDKCKETHF